MRLQNGTGHGHFALLRWVSSLPYSVERKFSAPAYGNNEETFRRFLLTRLEPERQISLYDAEDLTRKSRPVDSGRRPRSQSVVNHLAKPVEACELLNGDWLPLKLQLVQRANIARATIWRIPLPKHCSASFGLPRAQDASHRFSMPHLCPTKPKIRLCKPWPTTSLSGPATMVRHQSSRRKSVWNNQPIHSK